ncbi:MAG: porin [Paracoccaceae bacterium]
MKKVLLASTALVALTGAAAAEISIKGYAEMGIAGGDRYDDSTTTIVEDDATFWQDFTITIDASGETDAGMGFGMHIEFEESNGATATNGSASYDNESVFISGSWGKLTLGETDGALDKVNTEVALAGGSIADDETEHAGYNGGSGFDGSHDNQILRYDYSMGAFMFSASLEQANNGYAGTASPSTAVGDDNVAVGVKYSGMVGGIDMSASLAFQSGSIPSGATTVAQNGDITAVSLAADFGNGFEAAVNWSEADWDALDVLGGTGSESDVEHIGVGVAYVSGPLTVAANYGEYDVDGGIVGDADGYGLVINYDLGGGAVVHFGYGAGDETVDTAGTAEKIESWSLGLSMGF